MKRTEAQARALLSIKPTSFQMRALRSVQVDKVREWASLMATRVGQPTDEKCDETAARTLVALAVAILPPASRSRVLRDCAARYDLAVSEPKGQPS